MIGPSNEQGFWLEHHYGGAKLSITKVSMENELLLIIDGLWHEEDNTVSVRWTGGINGYNTYKMFK